ncbi:unnamed protein product [Camellia sinensis]
MAEFHKNSKMVKGINSFFISLVPKKENPVGLADYRPISLVSSLYKIFTKVLSSRLKVVIPQIISENQSLFIGGRNILDRVLVANEVVDSWKKARKRSLVIKLDFEKAYDSLNWGFLLSMMINFRFSEKWVKWIKECITSSRLSVFANEAPTNEFSPQRGFKQGDSLSPFLFIIAAEGLSILMSRALDLELIKGVKIGSSGVVLTHLQFADNSLILCEADVLEVSCLKRILRCFEMLSGLKMSHHKSVVIGVGVLAEDINEFVSVLNCKVKSLPFQYLGLPLGANPSRKASWRPALDKVRGKLVG